MWDSHNLVNLVLKGWTLEKQKMVLKGIINTRIISCLLEGPTKLAKMWLSHTCTEVLNFIVPSQLIENNPQFIYRFIFIDKPSIMIMFDRIKSE